MSISTVRSEKQLMKYILKDGQKIWKFNISDTQIEELRKLSYTKGKVKFAEELTILEDEFLLKKITYKPFVLNYLKLKAKYNHSVPVNTTRSYLNKMQLRRDPVGFSEWMYTEYFKGIPLQRNFKSEEISKVEIPDTNNSGVVISETKQQRIATKLQKDLKQLEIKSFLNV